MCDTRGGGDEIIFLARFEFQPPWTRTERPEGDGSELSICVVLVTNHHLLRPGVGHSAGDELLPGHAVDHMVLLSILWADQVELIIFLRKVSFIHRDKVGGVLVTEHGVGCVPIHIVMLATHHTSCLDDQEYQDHLCKISLHPFYLLVISILKTELTPADLIPAHAGCHLYSGH